MTDDPKRPEGDEAAPPASPASASASAGERDAGPDSTRDPKDVDALASLLRRSLATSPAGEAAKDPDLLRGVQRRIRLRSKGKFFGDGWSTSDSRYSYAVIALAMLVVTAVAYFALAWVTVR